MSLVSYRGSNVTQSCTVESGFVGLMNNINSYAGSAGVTVYITSSFRKDNGGVVDGAIVKPSTVSNHFVGYAIDMNLIVKSTGQFVNSSALSKAESTWPPQVRNFINMIRNDRNLRWGGDFSTPDVVHIDYPMNINQPSTWNSLYAKLQGKKSLPTRMYKNFMSMFCYKHLVNKGKSTVVLAQDL